MKSIKQQYIDLREGKISQHNFMRSVRMTLPQYITNVTSFKDTVKILKNKGILNENIDELYTAPDPIEFAIKSYLGNGYSYMEAIEAVAAEEGMDEEVLMSQYPQDTVDTEGHEGEDTEFDDMIARAEEEEAGKYTKNYDFPGGLGEGYDNDRALDVARKLRDEYQMGEEDIYVYLVDDMGLNGRDALAIVDRLFADDEAPEDYEDPDMFDAYGMDASEGKINEARAKKKKKKEEVIDSPNQFHPQEVRMGIKVEMEHTDDLDKAKKIALDHLRENPFYYTELKLSGLDAAHTTIQKPAAPKKAKKVKPEMVDKDNQMQKVKLVKEAKFNAMPGEEPNATVKHAIGFIQSNPVLRQISDDITLQNDGENAILKYGYWEALPDEAYNKLELQFVVEDDFEIDDEVTNKIAYILYPKKKVGNLGASLETGASKASKMDVFKETLESLVREVLSEVQSDDQEIDNIAMTMDETFDGRDNLDAENE